MAQFFHHTVLTQRIHDIYCRTEFSARGTVSASLQDWTGSEQLLHSFCIETGEPVRTSSDRSQCISWLMCVVKEQSAGIENGMFPRLNLSSPGSERLFDCFCTETGAVEVRSVGTEKAAFPRRIERRHECVGILIPARLFARRTQKRLVKSCCFRRRTAVLNRLKLHPHTQSVVTERLISALVCLLHDTKSTL